MGGSCALQKSGAAHVGSGSNCDQDRSTPMSASTGAWQVAAEAIVPINSEGGRTIGMRAHLFLFLDDLFPAVFGKPLLSR
jgi:hypothetical protein